MAASGCGPTRSAGDGARSGPSSRRCARAGCTFVRPVLRMDRATWITCHVEALAFFGAVPRFWICDNLNSQVLKADPYDPRLNRVYRDLAEHYGAIVDPARRRTRRTNRGSNGPCPMHAIASGRAAPSPASRRSTPPPLHRRMPVALQVQAPDGWLRQVHRGSPFPPCRFGAAAFASWCGLSGRDLLSRFQNGASTSGSPPFAGHLRRGFLVFTPAGLPPASDRALHRAHVDRG